MCTIDISKSPSRLHPLAIAIAISILVYTAYYILAHDPMLAMPGSSGAKLLVNEVPMRVASADITKEIISYLTSLTIALAAAAAFFVKDGFGVCTWKKSLNLVLMALVAHFIARSLLLGYDGYGMIAIQLAEGHFYVSRVQQVIAVQAQNLIIALFLTVFLIWARSS